MITMFLSNNIWMGSYFINPTEDEKAEFQLDYIEVEELPPEIATLTPEMWLRHLGEGQFVVEVNPHYVPPSPPPEEEVAALKSELLVVRAKLAQQEKLSTDQTELILALFEEINPPE